MIIFFLPLHAAYYFRIAKRRLMNPVIQPDFIPYQVEIIVINGKIQGFHQAKHRIVNRVGFCLHRLSQSKLEKRISLQEIMLCPLPIPGTVF